MAETAFYTGICNIVMQDTGGRGLAARLPQPDLAGLRQELARAQRVLLLTGFPVFCSGGCVCGETDGPSGIAALAHALLACRRQVMTVTDALAAPQLRAALHATAPGAGLHVLHGGEAEAEALLARFQPTHFITLERPGPAADGHYHNMRGGVIDAYVADTAPLYRLARARGVVTVAVGDGGNELGMGGFRQQVEAGVPGGGAICAVDDADWALAAGVSNWWGWGLSALLSLDAGQLLLPTPASERRLLRAMHEAHAADGCTGHYALSVDGLPLSLHLEVLQQLRRLTAAALYEVQHGAG